MVSIQAVVEAALTAKTRLVLKNVSVLIFELLLHYCKRTIRVPKDFMEDIKEV